MSSALSRHEGKTEGWRQEGDRTVAGARERNLDATRDGVGHLTTSPEGPERAQRGA